MNNNRKQYTVKVSISRLPHYFRAKRVLTSHYFSCHRNVMCWICNINMLKTNKQKYIRIPTVDCWPLVFILLVIRSVSDVLRA